MEPRTDTSTSENDAGTKKRRRPPWKALLVVAVIVAFIFVVLRLHSAEHDIVSAYSHLRWQQIPWLFAALGAETLSFFCYALVQRRLLLAGGAVVTRRSMLSLVVAATGLTNLVPGGTAPASGWLVGQYRRRGIPMPLALWAVLSGGYAATVSVLALLLAGAAIAGLANVPTIVLCALALAAGAILVVTGAHRMPQLADWLERHNARRGLRLLHRVTRWSSGVMHFRATVGGGALVLGLSLANWVLDVFVLVGSFGLLGLPIPWRAVVFAYATGQVAGSLAPVPGGIGFVEGGMIGAFALAGSGVGNAVAATVIYRVITCWGMAAVGSLMLVLMSRRRPVPAELHEGLGLDLSSDD